MIRLTQKLREWWTPDKSLRIHFLVAPFGGMATTYGLAYLQLCRLPELQELASYASLGVLFYGMGAVLLDLGGQTVFYTIGAILNYGKKRDAKAVELVASNPTLLRQANETAAARERENAEKAGK